MAIDEGPGDIFLDAGEEESRIVADFGLELFVVSRVLQFPIIGLADDHEEVLVILLPAVVLIVDFAELQPPVCGEGPLLVAQSLQHVGLFEVFHLDFLAVLPPLGALEVGLLVHCAHFAVGPGGDPLGQLPGNLLFSHLHQILT